MAPLVFGDGEIERRKEIAGSHALLHSIVQRAQIVLTCAAGAINATVAKQMGLTGMTVGKWRKRYLELGLAGLHDKLHPSRPRTCEDDAVAEVINRALQARLPDGSTHWSARTLAAATEISKTTVHRWLQTCSRKPHRQKHDRSAKASRLQAFDGSLLCGEGLRHRRSIPEPARQDDGALR